MDGWRHSTRREAPEQARAGGRVMVQIRVERVAAFQGLEVEDAPVDGPAAADFHLQAGSTFSWDGGLPDTAESRAGSQVPQAQAGLVKRCAFQFGANQVGGWRQVEGDRLPSGRMRRLVTPVVSGRLYSGSNKTPNNGSQSETTRVFLTSLSIPV